MVSRKRKREREREKNAHSPILGLKLILSAPYSNSNGVHCDLTVILIGVVGLTSGDVFVCVCLVKFYSKRNETSPLLCLIRAFAVSARLGK